MLCFKHNPNSPTLLSLVLSLLALSALIFFLFFPSPSPPFLCPEPLLENITNISSPPTNLSHIIFNIGASLKTYKNRQHYAKLWWLPNSTQGHIWLDVAPPSQTPWPQTSPPFRVSTNTSGPHASAERMARIIAEAYKLSSGQEVRWFVMGDDDTVFFVENLVSVLGKYDHEDMYYVGENSESVEQDVIHSYGMGFGGGGFAVSVGAAKELARVMDEGCLERYKELYGSDQRVFSCLAELGVPLTHEPGFHQVDLRGDIYGILAAHPVAPLVSLHHLDYVDPITPVRHDRLDAVHSLMDASRLDSARILQQCFCYETGDKAFNWTISVSWGYTVQLYPWVLSPSKLQVPLQTFKTWRSFSNGPFTFNTRPFMPDRPCGRPLLFYLDQLKQGSKMKDGTKTTISEYRKSSSKAKDSGSCNLPGFKDAMTVDTVRVFAPKMDPAIWNRAPRRQCCQSRRTRWGRMIEVRIGSCRPGKNQN